MSSDTPLVSVVIPAFKQAEYVIETVQSVLNQTYPNLEVIVVNDASPDNTTEVVLQITDPRVKLIVHPQNKGLPAARNTGMRASSGELIALLDADDLFHPDKLKLHVEFLQKHPEIGVTYNSRFELNHSSDTVRELWRPPMTAHLIDFVYGFPFSPSDMVIRRDWAFKVDLFDEIYVCGGEDTDLPSRLALAGCKFAGIDRSLNYRRYHSGRKRRNLPCRLEDVERTLNATFSDPRCPADVLAEKGTALRHHLMVLVSLAFIQDETDSGIEFLQKLLAVDPTVIQGSPCELMEFLMQESIADESVDHEALLKKIVAQFPPEISHLSSQLDWAVAQGYLKKGLRALIWKRPEAAQGYFMRAAAGTAELSEISLRQIVHQMIGFEIEFGALETKKVLDDLYPHLQRFAGAAQARWTLGLYHVNLAFKNFFAGQYSRVPGGVLRACATDLSYLKNRGVIAIFVKSLLFRKP